MAKELSAEKYADEIVDIADDGRNDTQIDDDGNVIVCTDHIQRSRLRVDARKWVAAKLLPKKYGEAKAGDVHVSTTVNTVIVADKNRLTALQDLNRKLMEETAR